MDSGEVAALAAEPARHAAGGPDQGAVAEAPAVRGGQPLRPAGRPRRFGCRGRARLPLRPEGFGPDQHPLEILLAGEIFLGERRPLVGRLRLGADQADRAREAELAKLDRGLGAAMAGADDDDVVMGQAL